MDIWVIPSYDYYGECCYSNIYSNIYLLAIEVHISVGWRTRSTVPRSEDMGSRLYLIAVLNHSGDIWLKDVEPQMLIILMFCHTRASPEKSKRKNCDLSYFASLLVLSPVHILRHVHVAFAITRWVGKRSLPLRVFCRTVTKTSCPPNGPLLV